MSLTDYKPFAIEDAFIINYTHIRCQYVYNNQWQSSCSPFPQQPGWTGSRNDQNI